jgi:DNA modification methylase
MKSYVLLRNEHNEPLPEVFQGPDVRYADCLVEHFLREFTKEGDVVFDPFAGFGTTLRVAEAMRRVGYGIEINPRKVAYARSRLLHPERLLEGDAQKLAQYDLPAFDFSITSPPYMGRHHTENPFTDYVETGEGYGQYLRDMQQIYTQMRELMKPGARVVIEAANLLNPENTTTLAWDIAAAVGEVLRFEREVIILWEPTYGFGYDHSYCLMFR